MTQPSARFTLITAARLLDGTGAAAVEQAALLIDGDRVADLGRATDVRVPDEASVERKDYGAATILPGLVDAHTHLVAPGDGTLGDDIAKEDDDILLLQAAQKPGTLLHSGVTTLRENGAKGKVAFSLREGIRRKLAPGPRMVICGRPITITGGHMGYFGSEADGEAAVRAEVRKLLKEGADYIKIVASGGSTRTSDPHRASYTVAELAALTAAAHRPGRRADDRRVRLALGLVRAGRVRARDPHARASGTVVLGRDRGRYGGRRRLHRRRAGRRPSRSRTDGGRPGGPRRSHARDHRAVGCARRLPGGPARRA